MGCGKRVAKGLPSLHAYDKKDPVLDFGMHKGKPLSEVDDGYLRWMQAEMVSKWWGQLAANVLLDRKSLQQEGTEKDLQILLLELKSCTKARNLERGKQIHADAVESGHGSSIYIANCLIVMYSKCGSMVEASQVFDNVKHPTVVSWTALISGYADSGQDLAALELFSRMKNRGPAPNSATFVAALKACTSLAVKGGANGWADCRDRGKEIHDFATSSGCNLDTYLQTTLVGMYSRCSSMTDAHQVFDSIKCPNVISWTALILGYAENGQGQSALGLFTTMRISGTGPNSVTFVAALKACTSLRGPSECNVSGKSVHNLAIEDGCSTDTYVQNTLLDMYGKNGNMVDAREVFDSMEQPNVVSWTTLIMSYVDNGQSQVALDWFARMKTEGPAPSYVTFVAALKACTFLALKRGSGWTEYRDKGKGLHNLVVGSGSDSNIYVQSTLVDMYAKCGSMLDARDVFDHMIHRNVVSWNALILGYAENREGHTALELFTKMRTEGPAPDYVTFMGALKACGLVGALEFGRRIHSEINKEDINMDVMLVNCLVDFYVKCGSLMEAESLFDLHAQARDVVTWNALLAGFSSFGDDKAVFGIFEKMQDAGFCPDGITFMCILNCCNHAGLVAKGKECFDAMLVKYGVAPSVKHYTCMIDIYGRANKLDDAMALLQQMPCSPDDVTWKSILGACWKWNNVEVGRLAFQSLHNMNDRDAAGYVLMGQIYESRGMLQEQENVMQLRNKAKPWTNEVGEVHIFSTEDCQHTTISYKDALRSGFS